MTERPQVSLETREATTGRVGPRIHGALMLEGERHGRRVSVRVGSTETGSRSEVTVAEAAPAFNAKSRKGGSQSDWLADLWLAERLAKA